MYETTYHRAKDVAEAAKLFAAGSDARYLSGGQTLLPTMKQRLAAPSDVIDLTRIPELKGISGGSEMVTIAAATTHAEVANSDVVKANIPGLADLAATIGDPAVRHRGTIGGSLANNDPAADYPAAVLGLDATIHTNKRTIAADKFFTGLFTTALEDGEIITKVSFPVPAKSAYMKFRNPASRYAIVGVYVARSGGAVRVAVTGAGPVVFRVPEMEAALARSFSSDAIKDIAIKDDGLNSDIHASAEYRAHLVNVMARRAVQACA